MIIDPQEMSELVRTVETAQANIQTVREESARAVELYRSAAADRLLQAQVELAAQLKANLKVQLAASADVAAYGLGARLRQLADELNTGLSAYVVRSLQISDFLKSLQTQLAVASLAEEIVNPYRDLAEQVRQMAESSLIGFAAQTSRMLQTQLAASPPITEMNRSLNYQFARVASLAADPSLVFVAPAVVQNHRPEAVAVATETGKQIADRMSEREYAAWTSVLVFLIVFISYTIAMRHSALVAQIANETGANSFDVATTLAGVAFWASFKEHR